MKKINKNNTYNVNFFEILRKTFIIFFSLIFIISLSLKETIAKYVISENVYFEKDNNIEFTINSVFVVSTAEELFAAINQGYTYVQLNKEIENPLIITQKAENLTNDLILDLNGIEIQRNGHEPILNINKDTRLTIIDSSDEQTGGLYNPVGSVFNINGGSLSVVTGFFESGPRYSEYYTYNNYVLDTRATSQTKRTIVENDAQEVIFYKDNNDETYDIKNAPIIKSYPTKTGGITYNHGNLYFDKDVTKGNFTIKSDTYCYYQTSEKKDFETFDTSMADWHYSYFVNTEYEYMGTQKQNDTDIKVTIYGYEKVIEKAKKMNNPTDYYAAIQMSDGTLDVQNGSFYQYFGIDTTACVNAQGGAINVVNGSFSSRVPNASEYNKNGISTKESDKEAFNNIYFDNFEWYNSTSSGLAKVGESFCILNGGDATVKIGKGNLYSSNNNIVSMQGGELAISGGTFTKKLTNGLNSSINENYLAAINMQSGTLLVENSNFNVEGNKSYGIFSTVKGTDSFHIHNTNFNVTGNDSTGIYSSNGTVNISANNSATIKLDGNQCKGISVANEGAVISNNYSYEITGEKSYGIYSTSGAISIENGNIFLNSDVNCYGIYAVSDDNTSITINNSTIAIGCKIPATGGYTFNTDSKTGEVDASVGVFLSSQNTESTLDLTNINIYSYELGIVSDGGTINLNNTGKIITNKASAIAIKKGNVNFTNGSNYTISSNNTTNSDSKNAYNLNLPIHNGADLTTQKYNNVDGIYVDGGSLTVEGNLNITHTGLRNETLAKEYYSYSSLVVTSYAVRVYGGDVKIDKGTIIAKIGGGIYAGKSADGTKGSITLGNESLKNVTLDKDATRIDIVKVYTKGNLVGNDVYDAIGTSVTASWQSHQSITGGHAVELNGGNITIYNGIYEAQFGNGIYVNGTNNKEEENGQIDVYNGLFYGYMNAVDIEDNSTINLSGKSGPSAFYGLKVVGGSEVHIYDGFFDGGNGGAFVTGVTNISNQTIQSSKTANVYIYKGTFGSANGNLDAFNVYDDVNIVFGAYKAEAPEIKNNNASTIQGLITLNSTNASIAANSITYNSSSVKKAEIRIYYGTYNGAMYLEPRISGTSQFYTYNTKDSTGKYTNSKGTIIGEQNNTTAQFYNG